MEDKQWKLDLIDLAILSGTSAGRFYEILHAAWKKNLTSGLEQAWTESRTATVSPDRLREIRERTAENFMFSVLEELLAESLEKRGTRATLQIVRVAMGLPTLPVNHEVWSSLGLERKNDARPTNG